MSDPLYIKAVKVDRNPITGVERLISLCVTSPKYQLVYVPGVEVRPILGKIFIFTDWSAAKHYGRMQTHVNEYQLWTCSVVNPIAPDLKKFIPYADQAIVFRRFWRNPQFYQPHSVSPNWLPSYTLWADAITLLENVTQSLP